jgi:hypothetical protein
VLFALFKPIRLAEVGAERTNSVSPQRSKLDFVRIRTFCAIGIVLMSAVAACGGSGSESFTQDDLVALLDVAPPLPEGSSWMKDDGIEQLSLAKLRQVVGSSPEGTNKVDALAEAGFQRQFFQEWAASGRSAEVRAAVFRDEAGADEGLDAVQDLVAAGWFFPQPVDDLGDEAVSSAAEPGAVYMWRRGNVVFSAWMFQDVGTAFDFDAAARAYADELDQQAAD